MDRTTLFAVVLSLTCATAAAQDALLLRDGTRRAGKIQSCSEDRCRLGGQTIERSEIAWIGLDVGKEQPPRASGAAIDEIYLADGARQVGTLSGLSLGEVVLEDRSIDRDQVRWIRLAGGVAEEIKPPPPQPQPPASPAPAPPAAAPAQPAPLLNDSSLTPVSRRILNMVPAASIGEHGQPVGPAFVFAPGASQITVVAQVGGVTGSPLHLRWFQVTDQGKEELFTHTVEVASFEAAYSVGKSPGTLTPGTYRVEATLAGESLSTQFEVQASEKTGATGQGATSGPPASGDSGAVGTPASDPPQSGEPFANVRTFDEPVDPGPPGITFSFHAGRPGGGARVEAQATMGGTTRTLTYPLTSQRHEVTESLDFNPCAHQPGGSDLPGTKAEFSASVVEGEGTVYAGGVNYTTLGPDTTKPAITIKPPPGRVKPGDKIQLDATAQENRSGPTWQRGMKSFQLTANPGGQVGEPQQARSPLPLPCDSKQWSLAIQGIYEVPANAPVIKICGIAEDFAGNVQTTCNTYYTGNVWTGRINSTWRPYHGQLVRTTIQVRLRELDPKLPRKNVVGDIVSSDMVSDGSVFTSTHSSTGTDPGCVISGHGSSPASSQAGHLFRTVERIGPGGEIRWSTPTYVLSLATEREIPWTERCQQGSWTKSAGIGVNIGGGDDPQIRTLENGRMFGSYTNNMDESVSWSICPAGTECPAPPSPP